MDTWLNKKVIDVLTAIRERHIKMSQALKCDGSTTSDVTWITVKGRISLLTKAGLHLLVEDSRAGTLVAGKVVHLHLTEILQRRLLAVP